MKVKRREMSLSAASKFASVTEGRQRWAYDGKKLNKEIKRPILHDLIFLFFTSLE